MAAFNSWARRSSSVMRSRGGFEVAQRVTDLRGLFVILLPHGLFEGVFELLAFRERAFVLNFLEPGFERMNFSALVEQVLAGVLPVKIPDLVQTVANGLDGLLVFVVAQRLHAPGPYAHHQQLRTELLEGPREFVRLGVFVDKREHGQVALGVTDDSGVILQLKQTDVAVVILNGLLLQLRAVVGFEREAFVAGAVNPPVLFEFRLVMLEEGFMAEGPLAVGPAAG